MSHLTRSELLRWRDTPSEADRATIVGHLAVCDRCSAEYAELVRTQPIESPRPALKVADFVAAGAAQRMSSHERPSTSASGAQRWVMAAAAVILLAVASWQIFEGRRLRTELARAEAARLAREQETAQQAQADRSRNEQLNRDLQMERAVRQALERELSLVSLFLAPGRVRGSGETKTLTIPTSAASVRLVFDLGERRAYWGYDVTILSAEGREVWKRSGVVAGDQLVVFVSAGLLAEDDYEVNVQGRQANSGLERVGEYYFTVRR